MTNIHRMLFRLNPTNDMDSPCVERRATVWRVRWSVLLGAGLCRELGNPKALTPLFCMPKIVLHLLVEPTLGGRPKSNGKANSHFRANTGTAIQNRR